MRFRRGLPRHILLQPCRQIQRWIIQRQRRSELLELSFRVGQAFHCRRFNWTGADCVDADLPGLAPCQRWGDEAAELPFKHGGKGNRRAIFKIGPDDLHANR